jgi:hypothetical protein
MGTVPIVSDLVTVDGDKRETRGQSPCGNGAVV